MRWGLVRVQWHAVSLAYPLRGSSPRIWIVLVAEYIHAYIHTYVVGLHMRYAMHVGMPLGRGRGLADGQGARGCKLPE